MSSRRTLLIAIIAIIVIVVALGLVALWLFGEGDGGADLGERGSDAAETGIVFVRSIETYSGNRLLTPVGIGAGSDGGFFVTLRDLAQIVEYDAQGDFVAYWGERGLAVGQMMIPMGVAVDRPGGRVYVTDRSRLRLLCYDLEGAFRWEVPVLNPLTPAIAPGGVAVTTFGPVALFDAEGGLEGEYGSRGEVPGQFDYARGIAVADEGHAFVADSNNARVQRIQFSGEATATVDWVMGRPPRNQEDATTLFGVPASVTLDDDGNVYVLDGFRAQVSVLDPGTGEQVHRFDFSTGSTPGQVYLPSGIAHLGGDRFAITDTANDRVQIFRLLLPERNNVITRSPWLLWLLLLPLLPLLFALGRRRWFVTAEALERAQADGQLRLLVAVLKRMYVLPEVRDRFADVRENDVPIADYLVALDVRPEDGEDAEERLTIGSKKTALQWLLLRRHVLLVTDAAQAERFGDRKRRTRGYDELIAEYVLDEASEPTAE